MDTSNINKRHLNGLVICLCWVAVLLAPGRAGAQEVEAPTIAAVEFEGLVQVKPALVRGVVGVKVGDPFHADALDRAIERILGTKRFAAVHYRTEEMEGGVRVIFELRERPAISAVRFEGNHKFRRGELRLLVAVKKGDRVDRFLAREGAESIARKYREAGFGEVVVTYDQDTLRNTGALVYRIEEGPRVRISKIIFEGATSFRPRQLKKQIATRAKLWFFRAGVFKEDRVESDVASLQSFYRGEGFLDARVTYRHQMGKDPEDLVLLFLIDEGRRYSIESIKLVGNEAFSDDELRGLMVSQVGRTFRRLWIDADVRAIQTIYGEYGYIYSGVRATRVFSDTPGLVHVIFKISEGDQFRVGQVLVRGNTRTRDKVVRRALNMYPPDDLWNLTEAREAERRLRETRIFEKALVLPVGDTPGVRDAIIDVEEVDRAGDFLFGAGITSNNGVVGSIVVDLQNFDLYKPPRNLSEFLKFQSFLGGGQHFRLELQPGTELTRFRIEFTEPYFMDKPLRLSTGSYLFARGRDGYEEQRVGFNLSFGKRFEQGRLEGWTGEIAMRIEGITIRNTDLFAPSEIHDLKGRSLITSVKTALVRDRTDSRFIPTKGDRLTFSYEQAGVFGGDFSFSKLRSRYTWYKTLRQDAFERKHVLQLRTDAGVIIGNSPVFERFYAGGIGSLRGFSFRGVGPRKGIDDVNVGSDWMVMVGSEYSFPLAGENVRGLFFLDSGAMESGFRASIGGGIRLMINFLGPLPLEFNLAYPLVSQDGDREQVFSFYIGTTF